MGLYIKKMMDIGTAEPFVARLFLGIMELRDFALRQKVKPHEVDKARRAFDKLYDPVLNALLQVLGSARKIRELIQAHTQKLITGSIIDFQQNGFVITESIDRELREETAKFLINSVIAIKTHQKVLSFFGIDIGFLFQKQNNFIQGIEEMKTKGDNVLADYLTNTRNIWSEDLIARRNSIEHEGWVLHDITYRLFEPKQVEMIEPTIDGIQISEYVKKNGDRVISYIEELTAYGFDCIIQYPATIVEIPEGEREKAKPKRFKVNLLRQGIKEWNLAYLESDFI